MTRCISQAGSAAGRVKPDGVVGSPRLLVCVDWFDPGVRAGGPIRSCMNLAMLLAGSARVALITSDQDLGASQPYDHVPADRWFNWRGMARVRYCSSGLRRCVAFVSTLRRFQPGCLYLNSMFSVCGTLWPVLWVRLTGMSTMRIVLAPRGMLKPSALRQKILKKRLLLWVLRNSGVLRGIVFHATSDDEKREIETTFGEVSIRMVPNVPCLPLSHPSECHKETGEARFCFVGRVHPTKNLLWLIQLMQRVQGACRLTVVGPIEDVSYYNQCLDAVRLLPHSVNVDFIGVKSESEVRDLLRNTHALLLPTLGENFGHAIFEALAVGTPVIISDRTVWRGLLARQAGWDIDLEKSECFVGAMNTMIAMYQSEFCRMQRGALSVAHQFYEEHDLASGYMNLFFA